MSAYIIYLTILKVSLVVDEVWVLGKRSMIFEKENVEMKHFNWSTLIYSISSFIYQKT